jgi:hypothetical protein
MLSLDTAYRSFGGEVEASSTPTICRLSDSRRHQLSAIALSERLGTRLRRDARRLQHESGDEPKNTLGVRNLKQRRRQSRAINSARSEPRVAS